MSDSEEYNSEESYEFEFEDDDASDNSNVSMSHEEEQLENRYYNAKSFKDDDSSIAITKLSDIIQSEVTNETAEWIYKSTKQIAKINWHQNNMEECLRYLERLLAIIPHIKNQHYLTESMNKIFVNYNNITRGDYKLRLYDILLQFNQHVNDDRLWFKINLSKFSILFKAKEYDQCNAIIEALSLKLQEVSEITKNSFGLEVIASEIQLLSVSKEMNLPRLELLYKRSLKVISPVTHPRIMGIIKECGGIIEFFKHNYESSRLNFYEAFKNFDESGSNAKDRCFKYLILLSLITENEFNPFESQETQHYAQEPGFKQLVLIIECVDSLDLPNFRNITLTTGDEFSQEKVFQESLKLIETLIIEKILLSFFRSYFNVRFDFIQEYLGTSEEELKNILLLLGGSGKLTNVKVNFVDKYIETSNSPNKKFFPGTLDTTKAFTNLRCLQSVISTVDPAEEIVEKSDDGDDTGAEEGPEPISSITNHLADEFLYFLKKPRTDEQWCETIDCWLLIMKSAVPKPFKFEVSTKDQIVTEQKLGIARNPDVALQLEKTKNEAYDKDEKIRVLQLWSKDILSTLS